MFRLSIQIEAILYLKGQPLDLAVIAECAGCDRDAAETAMMELMDDYAHRDSALEVVETPKGYTLQLRGSFQTLIDKMIPPEIGTGALRTLAAIAIKGSISQTDLVELRGSGAYQHVQELVEVGFVRKRRQQGSRSSLLQVTDKFHRTYELNDLPLQLPIAAIPKLADEEDVDNIAPPDEDEGVDFTTDDRSTSENQ
ncbi:SMC-Scp complex subunit ScpB [Chamaesiphon polymorphus]|uniref:SMC-Scp complex subunit ScpB n=1 Tax=Chamaesiphon polymorphus CCALA 037 TaxID=2107692 RepID=A0A2T1G580_9CYAN|nr:SMC-Scp complex subunit ScpB [Chamaesiphon polymorphus]PSB52409.1 SMC-Scp complex subunit ScpB [Chamaesiphon polymorphus CCALA 037]